MTKDKLIHWTGTPVGICDRKDNPSRRDIHEIRHKRWSGNGNDHSISAGVPQGQRHLSGLPEGEEEMNIEAIGMRVKVADPSALVVNTCSGNDTAERGTATQWTWANPTNRVMSHEYAGIVAVSVECLWQGTKIRDGQIRPDVVILNGNWRGGKGKRPIGAWAGEGTPLITTPGAARRAIYIPAYRRLIEYWWLNDPEVHAWVASARNQAASGRAVYLRDYDTGRGIDRNGPMSHAWLLSMWLNTGEWPK